MQNSVLAFGKFTWGYTLKARLGCKIGNNIIRWTDVNKFKVALACFKHAQRRGS